MRGISILLVLLAHAAGTAHFPVPFWLFAHGPLGVQIFFVISGYLITSLLLEEQRKWGAIRLGLFYARRALRIFPASYCFIAITTLLSTLGLVSAGRNDLLHALTYTMNYNSHGHWALGHLWSLSVEEQFYLVWPFALRLLSVEAGLLGAVLVVVASPIVLAICNLAQVPGLSRIAMTFPLVADAIATGCVLAILQERWSWTTWFKPIMTSRLGLLAPAAVILVDFARPHPRLFWPLGEWAVNLGICYCILRWSLFRAPGHRLLNRGWLPKLGVLSYSVYLWQQLVVVPHSSAWIKAFPLNIILAISLGAASYYLLERPLLELRKRLRTPAADPEKAEPQAQWSRAVAA